MSRLFEYLTVVRKLPRDQFIAEHPHLFLLQKRDKTQKGQGWTFKTQTISVAGANLGKLGRGENVKIDPEIADYELYPLLKSAASPWAERINVGRARNNDVVLSDSSVSKLHAHFSRDDTQGWLVTDAKSRNGTRINRKRLNSGDSAAISIGDEITFGRTHLRLVDSATVYDLVTQYIKEDTKPHE